MTNSQALGQCMMAAPAEQEPKVEYPLSGPRVWPCQPGALSRWRTRRAWGKTNQLGHGKDEETYLCVV